MYFVEMLGTAVFAVTGVLAVSRRGLDVVGAIVLGIVTALGGGTVRDAMIDVPVFWFQDPNYLFVAAVAALAAFWIGSFFRGAGTYRLLLYLDAAGAALFAVSAADKVLALGLPAAVAVMMGTLTGIGGGLVRDVLAGRPTLLMSREIYATPILLGCAAFVILPLLTSNAALATGVGLGGIFGLRALAIHGHWEMPAWLTVRGDD